ncbi:MAG TPA: BatA domain-containing protein [Candidatus Paceibacterota bacterium]|nr:BatA domain-containing protein [Verrucomicrobiota bacterium]HRZ45163.1 BatA domain-containing protein [Candidatus Paceibacterota bacterium]
MSFLAPLFLLGTLAVAAPVVFHLLRRSTREQTVFSSLMFLRPTPPRFTRRRRFEHVALLILRCLVLILVAAGFARPFFPQAPSSAPAAASASRLAVLLDASASMRRGPLWTSACAQAMATLRGASPGDQAAVFVFDRQVRPLLSFAEWESLPAGDRLGAARARLEAASPGWSDTRLGDALAAVAEAVADSPDTNAFRQRRIILLTDRQQGSRLEALAAFDWPSGIELTLPPLPIPSTANASLEWVADARADSTDPAAPSPVRLRIRNEPGSGREAFQVGWQGDNPGAWLGEPVEVRVPAGQSRTVFLGPPPPPGAHRVALRGDEEPFDNTLFVLSPEPVERRVLYLGREAASDSRRPRYFLERALQETARHKAILRALGPEADAAAVSGEADAAALIVVADPLPAERARALRQRISGGQTVVVLLQETAAGATLAALLGRERIDLEEVPCAPFVLWSEIDFEHPLFAPFADPRFSDFTRIHFWKYRRLDERAVPGARVIARYDGGDPAWIEAAVGQGRLLVLTSGWHPSDSQLALSSKFVPMLYSLLDLAAGGGNEPLQFQVGDALPMPQSARPGSETWSVRTPSGRVQPWPAGAAQWAETGEPGIYEIASGPIRRRLAVNLAPAESRTTAIPAGEIERLGPPAPAAAKAAGSVVRQVAAEAAEVEGRQKVWRWLLAAALATVVFESWWAGRAVRRSLVEGS